MLLQRGLGAKMPVLIIIYCFSTPNTDYVFIVDLPLDHKFEVFSQEDSTQWGFYPRPPAAIR